jgi:hypothetical protein
MFVKRWYASCVDVIMREYINPGNEVRTGDENFRFSFRNVIFSEPEIQA